MRNKSMTSTEHEKRMFNLQWKYVERPIRLIWSFIRKLLRKPLHDNKPEIIAEVNAERGRLVLFDFEVERLLGWSKGDGDYWYVTVGSDCKIHRSSCVMGFTPLFGRIRKFDYRHIVAIWNRNYPTYEQGLMMAKQQGIKLL